LNLVVGVFDIGLAGCRVFVFVSERTSTRQAHASSSLVSFFVSLLLWSQTCTMGFWALWFGLVLLFGLFLGVALL
jgi:hypothetical protein